MKLIDNNHAREHDFPCDHERVFGDVSLRLPKFAIQLYIP